MPDAPGLELILAEINRSQPGAVIDTSFDREQAALVVDATQIIGVLTWLKETPGQEYTFLSSVHGVDYLPNEPRFAVHYELMNRERYERLRIKALLKDPAADTAESMPPMPVAAGVPAYEPGNEGAEAVDGVSPPEPTSRRGGDTSSTASTPAEDGLPHIDSCVELFPTADFQEREVYDFFGIVFDGHPDLRRILMPDDYIGWPQRRDFPVGGEPVIFTKDEVANPGWWQ
ncbi:MAG: NADH-quinone oxidoreductase subunit C [Solirubrobacterales bacterium]